ncbi:MAG: RnfABCDGE type electron transport complex subunit D, partial [Bacilli bacterium]|nr:RnfABCDGE type electron transport complex subunit D [Bacilli bacterium]
MGPFIKSKNSTARMMINVVIALIPIILFSFYKNGIALYLNGYTSFLGMFYPLLFILVGTFSSFAFEIIYELLFVKSEEKLVDVIRGTYAFMPGLFLSLVLPINTPIYLVVLGAFFATIVGKMIFGGFGNNIFNTALIGALFILSAYSLVITNNGGYFNKMEIDTISSATPLSNYSVIEGIGTYEEAAAPYGGMHNLFLGFIPGSVGETSSLLCIIA